MGMLVEHDTRHTVPIHRCREAWLETITKSINGYKMPRPCIHSSGMCDLLNIFWIRGYKRKCMYAMLVGFLIY